MIIYLKLPESEGKTLLVITKASYTIARIKAAIFHTLLDANIECQPFLLLHNHAVLNELRTLESYGISNTKDYWLQLKPINHVSLQLPNRFSFAEASAIVRALKTERKRFALRHGLLLTLRVVMMLALGLGVFSMFSNQWYIGLLSAATLAMALNRRPQFCDVGGFTVSMPPASVRYLSILGAMSGGFVAAIAAIALTVALPEAEGCEESCYADRMLYVVVLALLGLCWLIIVLLSLLLQLNFRHEAGDVVEPLLLQARNINESSSIANRTRRKQLRAMSDLQRQALHFLEHLQASDLNAVYLTKHASLVTLLDLCKQSNDRKARNTAFRALERLLDVYETHEYILEHDAADLCCDALAEASEIGTIYLLLQCVEKLTATEAGCAALIASHILKRFHALLARIDLFEIIDRASAVLATLVLVHQYHTSEQEISLLVDISTMVLRSMDSEPAEGVLYLVNNVLEYHGYELTGAQTAQIFDDWSILCSTSNLSLCKLLARTGMYLANWNKCPERFIDQGGLDRLALLLDTASGTDQAIPVATSILAALQVLCQQQELVEPHQAQIDDIKAQAHIFVDPT